MPYPTTAEIIAASTVPELIALTPDQQDALRITSIAAIEDYASQSFGEPFVGSVEVESVAGDVLSLPRRLRSFESITPTGADPLESDAIAITDNGARLAWRPNIVGVGYYAQALHQVSGCDYPTRFPNGFVTIVGDWGWEDPPEAIVTALRFDMEDAALADANALTATVNYARKMGLRSINQGNLAVDLGPMPTLSPRTAALVEPYVFYGRAGRLV